MINRISMHNITPSLYFFSENSLLCYKTNEILQNILFSQKMYSFLKCCLRNGYSIDYAVDRTSQSLTCYVISRNKL